MNLFRPLLLLLILFHQMALGQEREPVLQPVYRNLVFEGGGIRGIAYGGALAELEKQGALQPIERVGGTSAGAIQAVLLAVGYTAPEVAGIVYRTPTRKFNDGRLIFFGGISRLTRQYGWYRGEAFTAWLEKLIKAKSGNGGLTFRELHQLAGRNGFRDLYVTGTNLTQQKVVIFSHETYPNMKIADAVRISMSVPLYYRAVFVNRQGQIVSRPRPGEAVDVLVDGGILANFPLDLFDHRRYLYPDSLLSDPAGDAPVFNPETLGVRLDREEQIEYDVAGQGLAPYPIHRFPDYVSAFYTLVIENLNRHSLQPQDWTRTISVDTRGYGQRVRHLSDKDKSILMESGREGVQAFFRRSAGR
jgi:NTE family protein